MTPKYRRILLKLSGEMLASSGKQGIDTQRISSLASQIKEVHELGVEIAIVIGGGNIFRGVKASTDGMDRSSADYVGMLATLMNALCLQDAVEKCGIHTRVMSAIEIREVAEPYIRRRATRHLEKGRVVIFGAGTGNPFFTTDTAASLRAMEIDADVILKATKVDGVYTSDPATDPDARRLERVNYTAVLERNLRVMDATAISLCRERGKPIIVFALEPEGNIRRVVCGEEIGTLVDGTDDEHAPH